jgi:hypothetical protein
MLGQQFGHLPRGPALIGLNLSQAGHRVANLVGQLDLSQIKGSPALANPTTKGIATLHVFPSAPGGRSSVASKMEARCSTPFPSIPSYTILYYC